MSCKGSILEIAYPSRLHNLVETCMAIRPTGDDSSFILACLARGTPPPRRIYTHIHTLPCKLFNNSSIWQLEITIRTNISSYEVEQDRQKHFCLTPRA